MKKIFVLVTLLLLSMIALTNTTKAVDNPETAVAYIAYASSNWDAQIWGPDDVVNEETSAVIIDASPVVVDEYGQYTVSIDLAGVEDGKGVGFTFLSVMISNGETLFPNSYMTIDSLKINDEEVQLGRTYTSSDDGKETRTNLYNEWVTDITSGRSSDGTRRNVTAKPLNKDDFKETEIRKIEVTFTLGDGYELGKPKEDIETVAYIAFATSDWKAQIWDQNGNENIDVTSADVTGFGQYTVSVDFNNVPAGEGKGIAFFDVEILNGEYKYPYSFMKIDSVKINDTEVTLGNYYTTSDDGETTRTNLYNEWVGEITKGRTEDGSKEVTATPVNKADYGDVEIRSIEVKFTLGAGVELGLPKDGLTAHLSMFDYTWENQYIHGDDENNVEDVVATTATIKGYQQYTVSLDFSGAASDFTGIGQLAVIINDGETYMPYNFIKIDSVKINGSDVSITGKSYTKGVGTHTRTNIFDDMSNPAEGDRTNGEKLEDVTGALIDVSSYEEVEITSVEVKFTVIQGKEPKPYEIPESFNAFMMFSDVNEENWKIYIPGISGDATVTGDGTYTIILKASDIAASENSDVKATGKANGANVFLIDIEELGRAMKELGTLRENDEGKYLDTDVEVTVKVYVDGTEVAVNQDKVVVGDIENKGRLRIELYNAYGPTVDNPAVDPELITPESELKVEITLSGTGIDDDDDDEEPTTTTTTTEETTTTTKDNTNDKKDNDSNTLQKILLVGGITLAVGIAGGLVIVVLKKKAAK